MTVPSYDDLTPGIPDDVDPKSVDQLTLFLQTTSVGAVHEPPTPHEPSTHCQPPDTPLVLYACLRLGGSRAAPTTSGVADVGADPALLAVARDFSPRIMRVSSSEVLLDVSGLGRLIGEPREIARQLARALDAAGVEARVAIAPTQTVARLLASAGVSGFQISTFPDFHISKFSNLPVSLLQPLETLPPAMNHRDRARPYDTFEKWGIATLGALAALPLADLSARLGRRGVALHRLARGLDATPFVPDEDTPRFIGRLELEWPIDALEPLSFVLARLLEPLSAALERADRGAAAIRLELRLTDRSTHARVLQLPAPMRDARVLRTLLLLDLESHPPSAAVDIVAIELDPAPARITQFSLLQRALPSPETLSTLTARLSALVGETRVGSAVLLDTHRPGAFEMARFAPESRAISSRRSDEVAKADTMAPVLEVGSTGGSVLRRQRIPPAIRVRIEHGRPVYIAASRRSMPQGAVVQAAGPWRTSGGWWSDHWSRDEWDVALTSGTVCRIFQDRTTARWFLEGIYD
jgi:protein ImuB